MAYRHTATQHPAAQTQALTAPTGTTQAAGRSTGSGALRRGRSVLGAFAAAKTPDAA